MQKMPLSAASFTSIHKSMHINAEAFVCAYPKAHKGHNKGMAQTIPFIEVKPMSKIFSHPATVIGFLFIVVGAACLPVHAKLKAEREAPANGATYRVDNRCFDPNANTEELGIDCSALHSDPMEVAIQNAISEALTDE